MGPTLCWESLLMKSHNIPLSPVGHKALSFHSILYHPKERDAAERPSRMLKSTKLSIPFFPEEFCARFLSASIFFSRPGIVSVFHLSHFCGS